MNEELLALLDSMQENSYTDWEYDFIMDVAEQDRLSDGQYRIVLKLYKKYIEQELE